MYVDPLESNYSQSVSQAVSCLQSFRYEKAYELILRAMEERPDAPQPHNLLGIYYELGGNIDLARRHYRAAYSLDPTFRPACRRTSCMIYVVVVFPFVPVRPMVVSFFAG